MAKVDEWLQEDKLILLEGWSRDGLTKEQIAKNMGISTKCLYNWEKDNLPILQALKKGKEVADYEVENALFKRAMGYSYEEKTYEDGVLKKIVTKEVAPDTTAQIFWLKKRQKEKWGDNIENENEEAIINATDILVKIRKTVDDRYERN